MIMLKIFLISVLFVTVHGCGIKFILQPAKQSIVCATDHLATTCHLLSSCRLRAENHNRSIKRKPFLAATAPTRCRHIKKLNTAGPCAPYGPTCKDLKCFDINPMKNCYRSKANNCRFLTICEMQRLNCGRGASNSVSRVSPHRCAGFRDGQVSTCRPTAGECRNLRCTDRSPTKICYSSNKNDCRLLTICEMHRLNCERGPNSRFSRVDQRHCAGLTGTQVATCGPFIRRCSELACRDRSTTKHCYRGNTNDCRLLTDCEMQRLNCERGLENPLRRVHNSRCVGLAIGRVATCRPLTRA